MTLLKEKENIVHLIEFYSVHRSPPCTDIFWITIVHGNVDTSITNAERPVSSLGFIATSLSVSDVYCTALDAKGTAIQISRQHEKHLACMTYCGNNA